MNDITRGEYNSDQNALWKEIGRLRAILEGPPHPGLETRVLEALTESRTIEKETAKRHASNSRRLDTILAILTALAGYLVFFRH